MLLSVGENEFHTLKILHELTEWHYHFGSVPDNWMTSSFDHSDWAVSTPYHFPHSPNQIQLYRISFPLKTRDLTFTYSFTLWLRFHYGCIVYLNDYLLYQRHISSAPIANHTLATDFYDIVQYRRLTFSIRQDIEKSSSILTSSNVLAVGLVALHAEEGEADFSCILSIDYSGLSPAFVDYTTQSTNMINPDALFDGLSTTVAESTSPTASVTVILNDDTRIWIGSIELLSREAEFSVSGLRILAKNPEDTDWTILHESSDWRWRNGISTKVIPLNSTRSFNQFRFERFFCQPNVTRWNLCEMILISRFADTYSFEYSDNTLYLGGGVGEIMPATNSVYSCSIDHPLPEGLVFDSLTCSVIGTPTEESPLMEYKVQGISVWKGDISTTLQLATNLCSSDHVLVSVDALVLQYDATYGLSLSLVEEDGSLRVLFCVDLFYFHSAHYSHSFCLPYGHYEISVDLHYPQGWEFPQGLSVLMHGGVLTEFTTLVPAYEFMDVPHQFVLSPLFQDSMVWEYWDGEGEPPKEWQTETLLWPQALLHEIQGLSLFLRAWVTLEELDTMDAVTFSALLNGSLQMWLNGHLVANLTEFDSSHRIIFSFALEENGAIQGLNRFAIEVHQLNESFDLIGQLSYGTELILHNSIQVSASSEILNPQSIVDTTLGLYVTLSFPSQVEFQFDIANQLSRFNGYLLRVGESITSASWSLYARSADEQPWNLMQVIENHELIDRADNIIELDQGMIGYSHWKLVIHSFSSLHLRVNAFRLVHLHFNHSLCPSRSLFPAVREGHLSPAPCPQYYTGYAYRPCVAGILRELHLENCFAIPPSNLTYPSNITFYQYVMSSVTVLSVIGEISFYQLMQEELPDGLIFDTITGSIEGIPQVLVSNLELTISALNRGGRTSTNVYLSILRKQCKSEGPLPAGDLKDYFSLDCAVIGKGVGTQSWICDLEGDQAIWKLSSGICFSSSLFYIFLVVCSVACLLLVRLSIQSFRTYFKSPLKRVTKQDMFSRKKWYRLTSFIVC